MNKGVLYLLERMPILEISIRCFLWKHKGIKEFISNNFSLSASPHKRNADSDVWENVKEQIAKYGIKKGDILLVHSSMDDLSKSGVGSTEVIDYLLDLVGKEGTLVFAAYPKCKKYSEEDGCLYYDPQKTIAWTGLLPNIFCRYDGVIRSPFPYNSLAAKGKYAEAMMKDNLLDDVSQGEHSSWKYCVEHHAKILFLGVSAALSCTMMNYPADALGDEWYIKNWHISTNYAIKWGGEIIYKTILEQDPDWYRYYTMYYSEYWMRKNGFLHCTTIDNVYVGVCDDMYYLAEELIKQGKQCKSVFRVPRKYWK